MTRTQETLTLALVAYLVLMPALVRPATAQLGARPIDPPENRGRALGFVPRGASATLNGFNGFVARATPGVYRHRGHDHLGGVGRFESPWGEEMTLRYWSTHEGLAIELGGEVTLHYSLAADGTVRELRAVTADREVRTPVGRQGELLALGLLDPATLDISAYQLVDEVLRTRHSEAFLEGIAGLEGAAHANCGTKYAQCGVCILGWASSFVGIAAACTVGGAVSFGLACLAAILGHEAVTLSCALTCVQAYFECEDDPDIDHDPPPNCDPEP